MTVLRSGSASDVGRVRSINEDLALESLNLFAVADGMGGHAGGEVAARVAIDTLQAEFARSPSRDGLVEAVRKANLAVWERSRDDAEVRGMGTTVTAAALVGAGDGDGDRLVLANVGDSRAYRLRGGRLEQLTQDHSVAEELVSRGELSEAEAAVHPHRHILTRALGVGPEVDVDAWEVRPQEGDRYLLCSDGLSNEVSPDRIAGVLDRSSDAQRAAETLVRLANEHGGSDNITAVVIDVVVGDPEVEAGEAEPAVVSAADGATALSMPTGTPGGTDVLTATGVVPVTDAETVPEMSTRSRPPASTEVRRHRRRVTVRSVIFILLLAGVGYGVYAVTSWYLKNSYFVRTSGNELVVYQGRIGGFLWFQPKAVDRTGVTTDQVPATFVSDLQKGVEEPSLRDAKAYVRNLVAEQQQLSGTAPPANSPSTTVTTGPGG